MPIRPVTAPLDAVIRPPGSKSVTNRALVCAALARGTSELVGVLDADDTSAMVDCLTSLGIPITPVPDDGRGSAMVVRGSGGRPPLDGAILDARLSGTTSRFIAPVAALARGTVILDGGVPLRRRPMGALLDALEALGAGVEPLGEPGHLPVRITASPRDALGGTVQVTGDVSSQFLSGLLLSGPCFDDGLTVEVTTELVSVPYVALTLGVMGAFGATVDHDEDWRSLRVAPGGYRAVERYEVEPDASAASYWAAAAVIAGGTVRIEGLGRSSTQGDVAFIDVLERMGAEVVWSDHDVVVRSTGTLRGVTVDMADISDTAQTLAAVAVFADGPTTVTGIGFIRGKETDRIAAVVTELRRLGVEATEDDDGFTVQPGPVSPGDVATYDDHRMAMSFALLGLRAEGIRILDPGCTAKTYPGFWTDLDRVTASARP
ncbi:3-phosphoshikimate 1-carboxyvinyltransferase [Dermatobacter hominis]|uniref:3-phosphoshikimate 1-carboxyvinyltransferase n=1 Tax=Dermatobacter hominis TaxID=2884263 RepID=UPI001D108C2E|nr:3-phosphoshikimate 1-carboxyvinyltransferase [Dermatobacter hominis]UDY36260.1 3-phosphoshikimate 1-carboxyvinyltransferase [Dermatobacter hominis]